MKKNILSFCFLLICFLGPASATLQAQEFCPLDTRKPQEVASLKEFGGIPVLNQGRVKPFESYASNVLLQFSGRRHYQKESALKWMARFLFAPRSTFSDKVFLINHPELVEALKIEPSKDHRYSFREIEPGLEKLGELARAVESLPAGERTVLDHEILRVFSNVVWYIRLSGAFAFALSHPDFAMTDPKMIEELRLDKGPGQYSFYDIVTRAGHLNSYRADMEKIPQSQWTPVMKEYQRIIEVISFWMKNYSGCPLELIATESPSDERWLSPMDIIVSRGLENPHYRREIEYLRDMATHYWSGNQLQFNMAVRAYKTTVEARLQGHEKKAVQKIPLELMYHRLNFLFWCKVIYAISLLLYFISLFFAPKRLRGAVLWLIFAGFVLHAAAIGMRIMILSRPPVSNLYETFIFVALIGVLLGMIIERINKNWLGNLVAGVCGFVFLLIASKYSSEGDTLQVLIAVLDSNFWLATHVISIAVGYAGCSVSGILGHVYLLQAVFVSDQAGKLEITYRNMLGVLGFGLTMTLLGTALGGIWADHSWGRFWGWDPKENGALMIVLWSAIIFHARISGMVRSVGTAVGCILGLIVVMWAWFGVNLLSVGLHSYGFTSGVAGALAAYVVLEIGFVASVVFLLMRKGLKF